ncbi:MAG: RDD family protein, partial [bacterium]
MDQKNQTEQYAGFWIRFEAILIDAIIVIVGLKLILELIILSPVELHLPFILMMIIIAVIYSSLLLYLKGKTIGKAFCGLTVKSVNNNSISIIASFFRESIAKIISSIFLLLGFIWVGFTKKKRAWHDYLAYSKVIKTQQSRTTSLIVLFAILLISGFFIGVKTFEIISLYQDAEAMKPNSKMSTLYSNRDTTLVEFTSLNENNYPEYVEWLNIYGKTPENYVIKTAVKHQVTIIGELHHQRNPLLFFNSIIPDLYHKAGITCIGMECIPNEMNIKINQLITAEEYDHELAMQIARNGAWEAWGSKEYWDVLETAWSLNRNIPDNQKKMRVIGIDTKWDGPSFLRFKFTKSPLEKILSLINVNVDFLRLIKRDELMARNIEKEIIQKGEKGIIWVGYAHAPIHFDHRMGAMLHHKYSNQIYQISIHGMFNREDPEPNMNDFLENIMKENGDIAIGFDLKASPFAKLRD